MSSINTNVTAMAAIRSLSLISNQMAKTQAAVESGLRINKANDDPAVFSIAQSMRADLNALSAVRDSLAFGKATLTVARDAATKISDELGRLKQTIVQGQQQGLDINQINEQITNALNNIDAYVQGATFNGVNLLAAGLGLAGVNDTNLNIIRDILGNTVDITGTNSSAAGLGIAGLTADQSGGGRLTFDSSLNPGNGEQVEFEIDGTTYIFEFSDGTSAVTATPNATTRVFDVQFDSADSPLTRIANLAQRMQEAGINAFINTQGELVIRANITAGSLSTTVTGATAVPDDNAIDVVQGAINTMGQRLATLGAALRQVEGLQDFTKQLTDSVREGLGALVDADLAEESARLTSLQTKQQLAIQSLSIANQQNQALLGLFR
ncbi:flagellin N-terminal helical domain-containing protein [Elioraea thermophila]|uniref:flagellin N-terminal helical domain-containing protein n=1 Tax=Elioraea thermophila TaxID=2185104 RepID=UPI000DF33DA3|nr:flagellin [Elioraea thermophila]